jgi:hypothetical protein
MGGWTRDYRRQFPTGCLPRSTVDKCDIAYTDGDAYRDCDCNSNIDAHCNRNRDRHCHRDTDGDCNCDAYGHGSSEPNAYSHSYGDSNSDSNSNGNSDTQPNRAQCAWLPCKWATQSGLVLERRDFESCRYLSQRRIACQDQQ